jgi:hypothetical protein
LCHWDVGEAFRLPWDGEPVPYGPEMTLIDMIRIASDHS